jgi:hypothetical protein
MVTWRLQWGSTRAEGRLKGTRLAFSGILQARTSERLHRQSGCVLNSGDSGQSRGEGKSAALRRLMPRSAEVFCNGHVSKSQRSSEIGISLL